MKKIISLMAIMACICGTAKAKTLHVDCVTEFIPEFAPPTVTNDGFRLKIDIPLDQPGKRSKAAILRQNFSTVAYNSHSETDPNFKGPEVVSEVEWLKDDDLACGADVLHGAVMCDGTDFSQTGSNEGLYINLNGVWQIQQDGKKARLFRYLLDVRGRESIELHKAFAQKKFPIELFNTQCSFETN